MLIYFSCILVVLILILITIPRYSERFMFTKIIVYKFWNNKTYNVKADIAILRLIQGYRSGEYTCTMDDFHIKFHANGKVLDSIWIQNKYYAYGWCTQVADHKPSISVFKLIMKLEEELSCTQYYQ